MCRCLLPGRNEVLVRVAAAGVAPWDPIIREGKSEVSGSAPLTLGSDLSGVVDRVGDGVTDFQVGDAVYGVTNPQFVGAQAEYAVCQAGMIAPRPRGLERSGGWIRAGDCGDRGTDAL